MTPHTSASAQFQDLGIAPKILSLLSSHGFVTPTPIQHQSIPHGIEGKDILGIAQTGTGKTLAFGIPMIQRLAVHKGQGLVLLPTRELALQVDETLQKIGKPLGLRTAVLIGGAGMGPQVASLKRKPHVVIATPGRLMDHLQQRTYSLSEIRILVLDEADRMFDIGFLPQIKAVLTGAPKERQTMLFSATMPREIATLIGEHMRLPLRIEVAPAGTSSAKVEQEVYTVGKDEKIRLLDKMLTDHAGSVLVFSRTKHGAKKIAVQVRGMGHTAAELHANRTLNQRKEALGGFKIGKYRVLVATDIAARGIDVTGIALVINFDLPDNPEDYVHRIGRTGRAGRAGKAVSFATPDQRGDLRSIERLIRKTLPLLSVPVLPPHRPRQTESFASHAPRGYGGGRPERRGFAKRSGGASRGNRGHRQSW